MIIVKFLIYRCKVVKNKRLEMVVLDEHTQEIQHQILSVGHVLADAVTKVIQFLNQIYFKHHSFKNKIDIFFCKKMFFNF